MSDVHEIAHGYTLTDLDRLARVPLLLPWTAQIHDAVDRYEIAWTAVAEHLCAAETPPTSEELIVAARSALSSALQQNQRVHGYDKSRAQTRPRFAAYWNGRTATHDFAPGVIDRTALGQIWPRLRECHRAALLAMATHGDCATAAAALGMTHASYRGALYRARAAFLRHWHEGETPSGIWGSNHHASSTKPATALLARRTRSHKACTKATSTSSQRSKEHAA